MLKLYENIKARRKQLKMTQKDLADKLGYKSVSSIAKIETGNSHKTSFYAPPAPAHIFCVRSHIRIGTGKLLVCLFW